MFLKIAVSGGVLYAAAAAQASFEVASVKLNVSGSRSTVTRTSEDFLLLQNWPLREIVLKAYELKDYALIAPDWLASRNFDIQAKAGGKMTKVEQSQMLQSLRAERFQLEAHFESREMAAYALLPAKGGPKLKPAGDGPFDVDLSRGARKTTIACKHCSLDDFAGVLSGQLHRAVVDHSGIPRAYSFTLEWSPDQNADDGGPSVFTALAEQLGLRLELRRLPIAILVVDSINRTPAEN
jgi:uncharacterized protein (TIGR03435 family)